MAKNTSRLMELDQLYRSAGRRSTPQPTRPRRPSNTLAPMEEVLAERRYRARIPSSASQRSNTSRQLRENLLMLLVLAASIYGLYHLCIYVLNH